MNCVFKMLTSFFAVTVCLSLCAADNGATGGCYTSNEVLVVAGVCGAVAVAALSDAYAVRKQNETLRQQNNGFGLLTSAIDAGNRNLQEVAAREGKCCAEQTLEVTRLRAANNSLQQQNNFLRSEVAKKNPDLAQKHNTDDHTKDHAALLSAVQNMRVADLAKEHTGSSDTQKSTDTIDG